MPAGECWGLQKALEHAENVMQDMAQKSVKPLLYPLALDPAVAPYVAVNLVSGLRCRLAAC